MASAVNNPTYLNQSTYLLADCLTAKNRANAPEEALDNNVTNKQSSGANTFKSGEVSYFSDNGIKTSEVQAKMDRAVAAPASWEVELDASYSPVFVAGFSERDAPLHLISACEDKASTAEHPLMYVEIYDEGVRKAYQVDVNKVDITNMTRAEGAALMRFFSSSYQWDGATFFAMTNICMDRAGEKGGYVESGYPNPDFQERINFFEECRKNYVGYHESSLSVGQTKTAMSALYAAEYDKTLGVQEQFSKVKEVMDKIDQTVNPGNWGQPKQSARRIEDFLLEIGRPWKG